MRCLQQLRYFHLTWKSYWPKLKLLIAISDVLYILMFHVLCKNGPCIYISATLHTLMATSRKTDSSSMELF